MFKRFYLSLICLIAILNQSANSQNVGINGTGSAPGSSAMLDVSATNKGMLIPRVSLSSTTDVTTISSPATSLLVYNTNASMTNGSVGYWYYDGATWVKFELSNKNWGILGNTGTTASTAAIGSTVNNNFIGNTDAKDFVMATTNLERMRIVSGGNIGIATTSPTNILSFGGNSARTIWMERHTTAATAGNSLTLQSGGAYSGGSNLNGGDFNISSGTSTGTGTSNVYIKTSTAGSSGTTDNAPSTKMTVLGSGNVGIGTTAPTNYLSLNGNSARTIWMERHSTAATAGNSLTLQSGGAYSGGSNLNGGDLNLSSGTSTGTGTSNIYFKTSTAGASGTADDAPSTKMTVLGSGNVGINTTAPGSTLDVKGTIRLSGSTSGYVGLAPAAAAGSTTYTLPSADGSNGQALTTNGSGTLTWATPSGTDWHLAGNSGTTAGTDFIGTTDAIDLVTKTSGTERMRVTSAGYVGIGTTTPNKALVVLMNSSGTNVVSVENTNASGFSSIDFLNNSGSLSATFGYTNASAGGIFSSRAYMNSYTNDFVLTRNSSEYNIFIEGSNGNVGIGTSTPLSSFEVNGAFATKLSTQSGTGAVTLDNTAEVWYFTGAASSITFPAAASYTNRRYIIVNRSGSSRTTSSYTSLAGAVTTSLANNTSLEIISDGTNWLQIK